MSKLAKEERNYFMIGNKHRISSDGKLNLILEHRYELSAGAGKSAEKTGEYGFNSPTYYSNIHYLHDRLIDSEANSKIAEIKHIDQIKEVVDHIDKVKEELHTYFEGKVVEEVARLRLVMQKELIESKEKVQKVVDVVE